MFNITPWERVLVIWIIKMIRNKYLKGVFSLVLIIISINFVLSADYCWLMMGDGDSIPTSYGTERTCDTTKCKVCYDSTNQQYANWNLCSSASVCDFSVNSVDPNDNPTGGVSMTITTNDEEDKNSKSPTKSSSSASQTSASTSTKKNTIGNIVNIGNQTNETSKTSLVLMFSLFSSIFFFLILIFLLFLDKKMSKSRQKKKAKKS